MKRLYHLATLGLLLFTLTALAEEKKSSDTANDESGFVPMFNGRDLTGWVNVNCAPSTFFVKDGEIITTGKPTGYLRTTRQYENFIADFEWMHVNKTEVGNSGFFVWADPLPGVGTPYTRGIEVQVLVNLEKEGFYTSQGDLFSIHGATCVPDRPHPQGWMRCLPSEKRCKGGGEWNHYKVIANNGTIKLHVNGKEVSGLSACKPRKGYLALESEGAECHFRNLKIKDLPSTNPKPEEVAQLAKGFRNLYTGLDLSSWKADDAIRNHWQPHDSTLHFDGKIERQKQGLESAEEHKFAELMFDFRFPTKDAKPLVVYLGGMDGTGWKFTIDLDGKCEIRGPNGSPNMTTWTPKAIKPSGQWNRFHVHLSRSGTTSVTLNGYPSRWGRGISRPAKGNLVLQPEGMMDFTNLFGREAN